MMAQRGNNLIKNIKVAAKDRTDLIMFIIAVGLSIADFYHVNLTGGLGFLTAYIFILLIRLSILKQLNNSQSKN